MPGSRYITGTNHSAPLAAALNDFHRALTRRWREVVCEAIVRDHYDYLADSQEDMILEDHARISAEIALYRDWADSDWSRIYPELPVASDDLEDWSIAIWASDDPRVRWEGCGPATPCGDSENPTVRTYALQTRFQAHVGNLEFYVRVSYIAEELPADVRERTIEIFRDLVLTVVDSRERVDRD